MSELDIGLRFDSSSYQSIRRALGIKSFHCYYCNKKVNKNNVGAIIKHKEVVCDSYLCLYELMEDSCQVEKCSGCGRTKQLGCACQPGIREQWIEE